MNAHLRGSRWSPYLVGVAIGILSWITFAFMGKALGVSTTAVTAVGGLERIVASEHVAQNAYFAKYLGSPDAPKPVVDWQFALVLFLVPGAFLGARLGRSHFREVVPEIWARSFGPSPAMRMAGAFVGGIILIYGARMAGGCTSGHAISGGLQLAVSSWVFLGAMFATGVLAANLLYRRGSHV